MPVEPPDSAALDGVSRRYGLSLSDADVASFRPMLYRLRAPGMMTVESISTMPPSCGWRTPSSRQPGASRHQTR